MRRAISLLAITGLIALLEGGCVARKEPVDVTAHAKEIEEWQATRRSRITRPDGWLTLVGLFWLRQGVNTVGGDSSNSVVLPPDKVPERMGTIRLENCSLRFDVMKGVTVTLGDSAIQTIDLITDEGGKPTILSIGTIAFYVIKRGDQLGVRVKDSESETRKNFAGLDYFPIDARYRYEARFEPYSPPKMLRIPTQAGTIDEETCPGALVFEHDGITHRLDAIVEKGSEQQLFIMFADATSGNETYGPGRQMYTGPPDSLGIVILDFNKAYNWPCVFTEYATCPLPPKQNHLPFRVEAGEKMYRGHH